MRGRLTLMDESIFQQVYPRALRVARIRARAAVGRGAISPDDQDDAAQEAFLAFCSALPKFDSNRASIRTFIEVVISSRLASIIRAERQAPCFEPITGAVGFGNRGDVGRLEMRIDVRRLVALLSGRDQQLALLLMECSASEASRRLGVARSTIYEAIVRLRTHFGSLR